MVEQSCRQKLLLYTTIFTAFFYGLQIYIRENLANTEEEVFEIVSNIHAVIIVAMISISFIMANYSVNNGAPGYSIILSFMGGYFLSDLISVKKWWKNNSTGVPYLIHHLSFLILLPFMLHCKQLRWAVLFMLLYEISTPFVNIRKKMYREYGKNSEEHINSAYMMYFVFFLVRIVTIPYLANWVFNNYKEIPKQYRYMLLIIPMYMLLNLYWFSIMTQNAWKHSNGKKIDDE